MSRIGDPVEIIEIEEPDATPAPKEPVPERIPEREPA